MAVLSFWASIIDPEMADEIVDNSRCLLEKFNNRDDCEFIILNFCGYDIDCISGLERDYPQNVMLVNCEIETRDEAFEIMAGYASGECSLKIEPRSGFDRQNMVKSFEDIMTFSMAGTLNSSYVITVMYPEFRLVRFVCTRKDKMTDLDFGNCKSQDKITRVLEKYSSGRLIFKRC